MRGVVGVRRNGGLRVACRCVERKLERKISEPRENDTAVDALVAHGGQQVRVQLGATTAPWVHKCTLRTPLRGWTLHHSSLLECDTVAELCHVRTAAVFFLAWVWMVYMSYE